MQEIARYWTFISPMRELCVKMCKNPLLKHVSACRRKVFIFLDSQTQTLDISYQVRFEGKACMVYVTTGSLRCFD
jgi:hypothetical protein